MESDHAKPHAKQTPCPRTIAMAPTLLILETQAVENQLGSKPSLQAGASEIPAVCL